ASGGKGTRNAHGESPSPRVSRQEDAGDREPLAPRSGERVAEGRVRGSDELRLTAPQTDRYTNRLPEFTADVARSSRRQIFFAATKGGREKVERLLKEFGVTGIDIAPGALPRGFEFAEIDTTLYSEWDLFEPPTSTRVGGKK